MKYGYLLVFIVCFNCFSQHPWSWLVSKNFTQIGDVTELLFTEEKTSSFTQLLFSWNASRPTVGYYAFYSQVKLANGIWDEWHHMADWGKNVQRSYYSQSSGGTKYNYVRLEMPTGVQAQGFRLKVVPCEGADLSGIKSIAANLAHMPSFAGDSLHGIDQLPSMFVSEVPERSQMVLNHERARAMCSPTSTSMLVSYLMRHAVDPLTFAQHSFDHGLGVYGSWQFNTAHAFEHCDGNIYFRVARLNSFQELHKRLSSKIPVVVSVRGFIDGAPQSYPKGHLLVVRGWDQDAKQVICNDPACTSDDAVLIRYPVDSFVKAWSRSHNLAYIAEQKKV